MKTVLTFLKLFLSVISQLYFRPSVVSFLIYLFTIFVIKFSKIDSLLGDDPQKLNRNNFKDPRLHTRSTFSLERR